ncbi:MAG TPA: lipase family protein [Gammaproteobacteria bacterium]
MAKVIQDVGEQPLVLHSDVREPLAQMSFLQRALAFAELSMISYNDEAEARRAAEAIGFEEAELFDNDGSQAYRFRNEHDCVVTCRGTEPNEWNDLKADANASIAVLEAIGGVHSGFNREVDDLWPLMEEVLRGSNQPVWFCGHSLGGAMATICAYRCKRSSLTADPRELHTFGSPRVGNKRYIRQAPLEHYRWVNNNDIVTRVPPPWMGYRHGGDEIYLDRNGEIRRITGVLRSRDRWRGFLTGLARWRLDPFADHSVHLYAQHIWQATKAEARGVDRGMGEVDEDEIVIRHTEREPTS